VKHFLKQLLQDKNGDFSLRELLIALFSLVAIVSWVAKQFFNKDVPDFIFYSFMSLVGAGCFGYSIEKKNSIDNN
jgi:hypothetical protein